MNQPFGNLKPTTSNFIKWPQVGASVTGTILKAYEATPNFDDAEPCAHLDLMTAEGEKTVSATQTALNNLLIQRQTELQVGATVTITFSGMAGNAKLFTLEVGGPPAVAAPVAPAPAPQPTATISPAPVADASVGQAPPV